MSGVGPLVWGQRLIDKPPQYRLQLYKEIKWCQSIAI